MEKRILTDKYGRQLNYLRLSVTDRCNFRCYYCMPEEGMDFAARKDLLSYDELLFLSEIFCDLGVSKIRITGGEPFVRHGIMPFLGELSTLQGLEEITVTTNGTLSFEYIALLKKAGIRKINVSIDSLDRARFFQITRRDNFDSVYSCILRLLSDGFEVKLNCVISAAKNVEDIIPFVELTRDYPLRVRFLEEMPFNGSSEFDVLNWNHRSIYNYIAGNYPEIIRLENEPHSTSENYRIPAYKGSFGIIASFSRTFCGTCNRIRLSATGELRTCLYGPPATNLRDLLRDGATRSEIEDALLLAVSQRAKDGFEAEDRNVKTLKESMSVLGG
ncbi:GTP 3',8-cyclase MoaA [Arcticibacter tournemirensis]|uniref:GTP 3',8-cyclase n=1 Tax=Arcticibacter tournemirensis TaxID=699437 RepID=A0A4Q0M4K9_9SPHI|nr:GTP 3',8-cyclase MoaA [Arcticibacter tournemirensis]RXF67649.1 GTP 3',8-cyclase MoaA [Arcticibacter tournemirensis]